MRASLKPLRRVSMYLYEEDVEQLEARYGRGWSEQVRLMVQTNCERWRTYSELMEEEDERD